VKEYDGDRRATGDNMNESEKVLFACWITEVFISVGNTVPCCLPKHILAVPPS
jgi:hypothetical protein